MFSGVRQNNLFYILEREEPKLKIGLVVSVSNPNPMYGLNANISVTVKLGNEVVEYGNLPASASIADSGKGIIVSDNKEAMNKEVESMLLSALNILSKTDYYNKVVKNCNLILEVLNPRLAKEKERDEDISNLKTKIGGLENKMDKILTILSEQK